MRVRPQRALEGLAPLEISARAVADGTGNQPSVWTQKPKPLKSIRHSLPTSLQNPTTGHHNTPYGQYSLNCAEYLILLFADLSHRGVSRSVKLPQPSANRYVLAEYLCISAIPKLSNQRQGF